ncbi:hypothetical protein [Bacillus sp. REN10]|nr:hypothetical protein [Bacillus sp. REN10]
MNASESMLTYRKEEHGNPLVAGACSWIKKSGRSRLATTSKRQVGQKVAF